MKGPYRPSTQLFFTQTLPTISFQHYTNKKRTKEKTIRLIRRFRGTICQCAAAVAIGGLLLVGTYLFFIQLAEYGW